MVPESDQEVVKRKIFWMLFDKFGFYYRETYD